MRRAIRRLLPPAAAVALAAALVTTAATVAAAPVKEPTLKGRALLARKGRLVLRLRVTATPGTAGDKPSELRVVRRVTLRP